MIKHNILLVGSGAREHALAKKICKSPYTETLACFATNNNPGIINLCQSTTVGALTDHQAILDYAKQHAITMAVVGPEAPLANGLADILVATGIAVIGPKQALAQLESSKGFARKLLHDAGLKAVLPHFTQFDTFDAEKTQACLDHCGQDFVIKADGLKGGKGVFVSGDHLHTHQEALACCEAIKGPYLIEEKLVGEEFSLISFCDGVTSTPMPLVKDFKRAFDGDKGPNTGGMGSISYADHSMPFLTPEDVHVAQSINTQTLALIKAHTGEPYIGFLYGGFMKTADGVKLIEYNVRLGDPEAMNLLALLETDLVAIFDAMVHTRLEQIPVKFTSAPSICHYLVPEGYPENPLKGARIDVSELTSNQHLYYAAVDQQGDDLMLTGSRSIALLGMGDQAYNTVCHMQKSVKGPVFGRSDIGSTVSVQTYEPAQ